MSGAAPNLQQALDHLMQVPRGDGRGRVFAGVSAAPGAGTSYVLRHLALRGVASGQRTVIIDLDFSKNAHYHAFSDPAAQSRYGATNGPYDAVWHTPPVWQIQPVEVQERGRAEAKAVKLFRVGASGPDFTMFDWSSLRVGQNVMIVPSRAYWNKLRDIYDLILVDCPSLTASDVVLGVAPEADGTVLIAASSGANAKGSGLPEQILSAGGRLSGTILNDVSPPAGQGYDDYRA